MKYPVYAFFALMFACTACTKTKTNTVTVTKYDTVSVKPSLLGTWHSSTGITAIVFTTSTVQWQSYPAVEYLAATDTIYDFSESSMVYARWAYNLSIHNDTLTLITLSSGSSDIYTKN